MSGFIQPGSAAYIFRVKMATDERLKGNPLNQCNVDWWEAEKKRIEAIRSKNTLKIIATETTTEG